MTRIPEIPHSRSSLGSFRDSRQRARQCLLEVAIFRRVLVSLSGAASNGSHLRGSPSDAGVEGRDSLASAVNATHFIVELDRGQSPTEFAMSD